MIHKDKTLAFIAYVVEHKERNKLKCMNEKYLKCFDEIVNLIDSSKELGEIYLDVGKYL